MSDLAGGSSYGTDIQSEKVGPPMQLVDVIIIARRMVARSVADRVARPR